MTARGSASLPEDDVALVARIAAGEKSAFEELYHLYRPRLFSFVFRTIRRAELVEEVIDDVMLAVWRQADTFAGRARVSTWIFGIAYRQALRALEREGRRERIPISERGDGLADPADARAHRRELSVALGSALRELSVEQRAVVELAVGAELGYREIAGILACPENTVKTRMFHARRRMRAALVAAGIFDA